jgi:hypothetical protein
VPAVVDSSSGLKSRHSAGWLGFIGRIVGIWDIWLQKIVLSSPQHCDLFIVGDAAPEQTRKEMVE